MLPTSLRERVKESPAESTYCEIMGVNNLSESLSSGVNLVEFKNCIQGNSLTTQRICLPLVNDRKILREYFNYLSRLNSAIKTELD